MLETNPYLLGVKHKKIVDYVGDDSMKLSVYGSFHYIFLYLIKCSSFDRVPTLVSLILIL